MSTKALSLFSGGLDSILAVKILQNASVNVTGISFVSYFFDSEQAKASAEKIGLELIEYDLKDEHFKMLQNPVYGYGKYMNPCIDCHALMFRKAGEVMREKGFDFLASGEVLGQRPKSQNIQALKCVEKLSGVAGYIVRPLSAKLLDETIPEKEGLLDRNKLFDISGRGRGWQIELAKKFGIKSYPSPAGGCLLTDKNFSEKLKDLLEKDKNPDAESLELLKIGRHFWSGGSKIVVGRDKEECLEKLPKLASEDDVLLELADFKGPLVLIHGKNIDEQAIQMAAGLTKKYCTEAKGLDKVGVKISQKGKEKIVKI
ncbi:MAG: tRNA 4-thiouridine(8) synthase ThiI [Patescibacteria group bacterium]